MCSTLKIAARSSKLSRAQILEVMTPLNISYELLDVSTYGDIDRKTSLKDLDKTDFFTREVDDLVLSGQADLAIHSAKDLPSPLDKDLRVLALTASLDSRDSLVYRKDLDLNQILTVGTSSLSREQRVREFLPKASCVDIRGTIEERLSLVDEQKIDAVVIAEIALKRLNFDPLRMTLPGLSTPLQGSLALLCRFDQYEKLKQVFYHLDSRNNKTLYFGLRCPNAEFHHFPLIKVEPLNFLPAEGASHYLFTSQTAVDYYLPHLKSRPIFCTGTSTKSYLEKKGFSAKCPQLEQAEGIIELLKQEDLSNAHIVWPRSELARDVLSNWLREQKIKFTEISVYTCRPVDEAAPDITSFSELIFTSPSTIQAFKSIYGAIPKDKKIICKGAITERELEKIL